MTPATATIDAGDRLAQGWREGYAPQRGDLGGDPQRRRSAGCPARSADGGRLTLEQRLDSVWEGLRAGGAAECPVCGGRMEGFEIGRCRSCGSELF
jgi:hypothetical protein